MPKRKSYAAKDQSPQKPAGFLQRVRQRLNRGDSWLTRDLADFVPGGKIDDEVMEELETRLLMADVGVDATHEIIDALKQRIVRKELNDLDALLAALEESLVEILEPCARPLEITKEQGLFTILVVGVNGAGKTTTIGKLARRLIDDGYQVMLAAGDTFRAAATEQLQVWGERNNIPVIAQQPGADPAAVIFDAMAAAKARGIDVLLADTAGRLQSQSHLMEELKKIHRVMRKADKNAPQETLLVLDAGLGQNALSQAQLFDEAIGLSGLVVTKLDGTAKGGIVVALAKKMALPLRFIGVGESLDDLGLFDARTYAQALVAGPGANS
ncbi:MAG: signal recognition particle-docking protein FtsY [Gammaproteobacteria bacterium]|nr:signal recognition particle-docking protein FtsY [Gammaproteobacteria bacterium]